MKFSDRLRQRWPFYTGDCLIEVTALAGLTVFVYFTELSAWNSDKITGRGITSKRDNGNTDRLENLCTRCQERFIW